VLIQAVNIFGDFQIQLKQVTSGFHKQQISLSQAERNSIDKKKIFKIENEKSR
jgi:hypothetical protein